MFRIELVKQETIGMSGLIFGRIYINGDCKIPNGLNPNPGVIGYYPESWVELWLKLGRCEITNPEILEKCLAIDTDASV